MIWTDSSVANSAFRALCNKLNFLHKHTWNHSFKWDRGKKIVEAFWLPEHSKTIWAQGWWKDLATKKMVQVDREDTWHPLLVSAYAQADIPAYTYPCSLKQTDGYTHIHIKINT